MLSNCLTSPRPCLGRWGSSIRTWPVFRCQLTNLMPVERSKSGLPGRRFDEGLDRNGDNDKAGWRHPLPRSGIRPLGAGNLPPFWLPGARVHGPLYRKPRAEPILWRMGQVMGIQVRQRRPATRRATKR